MKIPSVILVAAFISANATAAGGRNSFTDTFVVDPTDLTSAGTNQFFILAPGYQLELEGEEDGRSTTLTVTVLDETRVVDGVETRIVEEREFVGGELKEVSRNYFAISRRTTDVFYFGEDVDMFKDGEVTSHDGAWLAGVDGARFGLMMPGTPLLGARYHQEIAPGVAMDRAEVLHLDAVLETPAGRFSNCLQTTESSAIESGRETKTYAPGIGLIQDAGLKLSKYGFIAR